MHAIEFNAFAAVKQLGSKCTSSQLLVLANTAATGTNLDLFRMFEMTPSV